MDNYFVYEHISPGEKRYIGITYRDPIKRWGNCGYGYHKNEHLYRAIRKYGWDNFTHNILASHISKEEAEQMEVRLIEKYQSDQYERGYNIESGGNSQHSVSEETRKKISLAHMGLKGQIRSEETRAKMSAALKGRGPSPETAAKISAANKGKHPTDEARLRMSEAGKQRTYTDERNQKVSAALTGRIFSEEARKKMSESHKSLFVQKEKSVLSSNRSPLSEETKEKIRNAHNAQSKDVEQLAIDGTVIGRFISLVEAEEKTGIKKPNIWCACSGKSKSAGGFRWQYA